MKKIIMMLFLLLQSLSNGFAYECKIEKITSRIASNKTYLELTRQSINGETSARNDEVYYKTKLSGKQIFLYINDMLTGLEVSTNTFLVRKREARKSELKLGYPNNDYSLELSCYNDD